MELVADIRKLSPLQHPIPGSLVAGLVVVFAHVGHAGSHGEALAQRACGHVHEIKARGGVALQVVVNLAQVEQLGRVKQASLRPR